MKSTLLAPLAVSAALALGAGLGLGFVSTAQANNLDRLTATQVAKDVARADCRHTTNCKDWVVRGLHRVSRHKALGKIAVLSTKNGSKWACRRQVLIKLDHLTGDIDTATSARRCVNLGPA
jgi:hypothetical protein